MQLKIKQQNIPWIGVFVESLFNSLPFLSIMLTMFNFISIIIVLYTNIKPNIMVYAPKITAGVFVCLVLGLVALLVVIIMVVIYKYITPSLWTFRNKQMNKYDNEVIKRIKRIEAKMGITDELE
jgi:hypothetical protein